MTQEDKQLLLKDLCMRLPYRVKVRYSTETVTSIRVVNTATLKMISTYYDEIILSCYEGHEVYDIKMDGQIYMNIMPFLRPMSSMTEKEEKDYYDLIPYTELETHFKIVWCDIVVDWLNAHHFDYRGLIPMGLALPAPEGMYN